MKSSELCELLFTSLSNGELDTVRQICTDDFSAIQNNGTPMNLDTLLDFTAAVLNVVKDFRYENAIRSETNDGFVEEHLVRGVLPDSSQINLAACVVATVENGKITQLREYVDTAAAQGLIQALY